MNNVGANSFIQQELGLKSIRSPLALPLINSRLPLREYQEMVWGYPEPTEVQLVPARISTSRYTFWVLETPGHSPDHISLFEPEQGWCFSGDLFVSENLKMLRADEDIDGILASLENVISLPAEEMTLFTSLGRVFY